MFITQLIRIDHVGDEEVKSIKATFIGETTDSSLEPLKEWFRKKERRVTTYLANSSIYPRFELVTTHSEEVVVNHPESK